jgi:hypothetical protein
MPKLINLNGKQFGLWTVLGYTEHGRWLCRCQCGQLVTVFSESLSQGRSTKCKSGIHNNIGNRARTHGMSRRGISEYSAWLSMKQRCSNPNYRNYKFWGGRGIAVCERWKDSFENFFSDMGKKPTPQHSLDRIDNDKGYGPDNCRWVTRSVQNSNRRPYTRPWKLEKTK